MKKFTPFLTMGDQSTIRVPSPMSFLASILIFVLLVSCTSTVPESALSPALDESPTHDPLSIPVQDLPSLASEPVAIQESGAAPGFTYPRPDGNRLVSGSSVMPIEPLDISLAGKPVWVVAAPTRFGSIWVVALADGQVQAFQIEDKVVSELRLNVSALPPGMPPVLQVDGSYLELLTPPPDASPTTSPVRLEDGALAYITTGGNLRLNRQGAVHTLEVDALPDARILTDGEGRLLFLSSPTTKYAHGVLGDEFEAKTITLVEATEDLKILGTIQIDPADVIEGIAPIWVDLDGDDDREIIVTQSNAHSGARIVVYREDGSLFASGESIGQGFRWRHQLAVGQFIEGGYQEIGVIRTPHIGGVLEIYAIEQDRLTIQAELEGYSSHQIGSRNLDSALAADFDGDGQIEIVVPDQSQTTLSGMQWTDNYLNVRWESPIGGRLSTNLAAVRLGDGRLALGVGHAGRLLRVWLPN